MIRNGDGISADAEGRCPECGHVARTVQPVTLQSLLAEAARQRLTSGQRFRFCAQTDCAVVYFDDATDTIFRSNDVRVPVFQKDRSPSRPICYCFGHTLETLLAGLARTGASAVPASIAEKCRRGLDRCEETNPQGSCCLGNVRQVVAGAAAGRDAGGCCRLGDDLARDLSLRRVMQP